MKDEETESKWKMDPAQLRRVLPLLTLLLALLAAWLLVSGVLMLRDDLRRSGLEQARDGAVQATAASLRDARTQLSGLLASAPVAAPLQAGDPGAAQAALVAGWKGAGNVQVHASNLEALYAALPTGRYGPLATMEAALASGKPAARVIDTGKGARLAVAAPAGAAAALVAYGELPLEVATAGVQAADPGAGYLALRQGRYSVLERGNQRLNESAEALSAKVPDSDLRIAAALPDGASGPFGLGAIPELVAGALALLGALAIWFVLRPRLLGAGGAPADAAEQEPTLADLQPVVAPPAPRAAPSEDDVQPARSPRQHADIDRGIFRAYDIRGIVGKTLDPGVAELIGQAIGTLMHEQGLGDVVIGRDGRLSGPELADGLMRGLRKAGRNVIDVGMVPTPVVYFGTYHLRTGCGVAITGSHNPPDYNGFKIVVGGQTLAGDAIVDLYARIAEDRLHDAPLPGEVLVRDIADAYVERISGDIQTGRRLKVVVDAGNGVAGIIGPRVLEAIGVETIPLYCEIDGTFPNHHPDPSDPHNLEGLVQMVQHLGADLGLAFDGDGDRLGVVTPDGTSIFPDRLLMLFAADVLERNPGAVIVYDVKCTGRLPTWILRHGGSPLMWKTGHSLIKAKMRETEAELAGEMSGHFFFAERWYGFDDGIYAAARLLEILDADERSPQEVLAALPDGISTPEIKVAAPDDDPHAFVDGFRAMAQFEGARASTIDGLRVDWPDGWGLVRASNTTPVLVLRFDADSREAMVRIQQAFRSQLLAYRPDLELPF